MKLSRDTWLALGVLLALLVITVLVSSQKGAGQLPALASISSAQDGALALKLWLRAVDYEVVEDIPAIFRLPAQAKIVLVLQPLAFDADELKELDKWVTAGGTLIAAGDNFGMLGLARHFDFGMAALTSIPETVVAQTPLFLHPVLQNAAHPKLYAYFVPDRATYVTHLAVEGKPVLVSFDEGQGRVILASTAYPFTNLGLKEDGNPALVLNLLALAKSQGPLWFDEWHHGFRGVAKAVGPENWLRQTPLGRALLFVAGVIFLALLLQGLRFGRPVPLPRELRRRGALEHVTAVANLSRLAGHRRAVLAQYHHAVKRSLGRRYRLDPSLHDAEYVAQLTRYNPAIDGEALLALLKRLQQKDVSESELVKTAAEAAQWIKE
jgi:hypothetical protein